MKSVNIVLLILGLCASTAFAQHQLTGTVKNAADGSLVSFVTVALLRADSTVITGAMTGDDGKFLIQNAATGEYILQISFIGYEIEFRNVNIPAQSNLGDIKLTESATRLNELVVTSTRPLITMRADRYVVNVSGNIQSAGRNAMDILRNIPGVLVDQNEDISIMGNTVQVFIDGRPSRMTGEQLRAFLSSMQGGEIDRIEVVTNPSSRYEAEGAGGIIDIRTKRGLSLGVNGTLTAGYRQGRMDRQNTGVSMNWRREKLNVFGNYSFNRDNRWDYLNQINVLQTPEGEITLDQRGTSRSETAGLRHSLRAGADYFINQKNILGVIVNTFHSDIGTISMKTDTDISPSLNGVSRSTADNARLGRNDGIQVNMNFQSTFSKPGQQLNFDLDYARFYSNPLQKITNSYFDTDGVMIGAVEQFNNVNPQTINVYSAKTDYTQPLWRDAVFETGARFSHTVTDNDLTHEVFVGNNWQINPDMSNRFVYAEQINAAYLNVSQKLGNFQLQGGLRAEYTYAKGEQKTTGEVNDTTYFNLFPTFFVNYRASRHIFGLSYSRRLSRPNFFHLNPFEVMVDAFSFVKGNPYLMPAYTHNLQFSYTLGGLMTRFSYANTTGFITQVPIVDEISQRTGIIWQNFERSQNFSAMVNYRRQLFNIWTANLMTQYAYVINTSDEATSEFINRGSTFIANFNNNFTITPTLSAEVTGLYVAGIRQGYFVVAPFGNLSVGLRQTLLNNRMALSLNVNDILFTDRANTRAQFENVNNTINSGRDSRFVHLTVRYNFGSTTVRAARQRQTGIEDEAARARGGQ